MPVDQAEIEMQTATPAAEVMALTEEAPAPEAAADPEIERLLRIRVPIIVRLARRGMPLGAIRNLAPGAIIEFERSVDQDLDLLINNHPIGAGTCVKVGERFGIRLTRIDDRARRIQSLGS